MCAKSKQNISETTQYANNNIANNVVTAPKPEKPKLRVGTGEFKLTISDIAAKKINRAFFIICSPLG